MSILDYQLCYVSNQIAWFTPKFDEQWGDDWNDAPYWCNAGEPYDNAPSCKSEGGKEKHELVKHDLVMVPYYGYIVTPEYRYPNQSVSVEDINNGVVPWFTVWNDDALVMKGGQTLREFIQFAKATGTKLFYTKETFDTLCRENEGQNLIW